jgi:hypothetical protein
MKNLLMLFVFLIGYQSYSQITLDKNDYPFPLDWEIPMYYISLPNYDMPVAGEDQTWEIPYVAWANYFEKSYFAGNSDQFPVESRYYVARGVFSLFNIYSHYYQQKKADGLYRIGSIVQPVAYGLGAYTGSSSDSLIFKESINHFDDSKNVVFPMTMGTKWEQNMVYKTNFDLSVAALGLPKTPSYHKQYVNYKKEVDGWGKMSIPVTEDEYFIFDVLQVKVNVSSVDSFFVADELAPTNLLNAFNLYQGMSTREDVYEYYAEGFTEPIVRVFYDSQTNSVQELQYLEIPNLSVESEKNESGNFVYPNPVTGNEFTIVSKMIPAKINLYDQQGNIVISRELNSGSNTHSIEIPAQLANGIYYIELFDAKGKYFEKGKIAIVR